MSVDGPESPALGSPKTDSVTPSQPLTRQNLNRRPDVPTVEQRVAEFVAAYPHLAGLSLSDVDGRKLRAAVVDEVKEQRTVVTDEPEEWRRTAFTVDELLERTAVTWADAVRAHLTWYERNREKYGRFGKGRKGTPERESFTTQLHNSWQPEYQKREYAKLQAMARETTGGERPSGEETAAAYSEPWILFVTRSTSSAPDGQHRPPVDHDREIVESWDGVYHTLRNAFRRLGLESGDWAYHRQAEPHAGGGPATCFGHEHTMVVFDAAPMERPPRRSDFQAVIDVHVRDTEHATAEAHEYEQSLTLEPVGEDGVGDVAGYMGKYISHDQADLLERDVEYLAWAAVQWATNTQKAVRSDNANAAITADRCRQQADAPDETGQVRGHGDEIRRRERRRGGAVIVEFVCASCGSPWGIDQEGTLASKRVGASASTPTVVADGGAVVDLGPTLSERWPSAKSGASVGEPPSRSLDRRRIKRYLRNNPDATTAMVAGALELAPSKDALVEEVRAGLDTSALESFEREPSWRLEAIVDRQRVECVECRHEWLPDGDDVAGHCPKCGGVELRVAENENVSPGHVDMRPLFLPEQRERERLEAVVDAVGGVSPSLYTCECGVTVGPAALVGHLLSHGAESPPEQLAAMVERAERRGATAPRVVEQPRARTPGECLADRPREWCHGPGASATNACGDCYLQEVSDAEL